MNWSVFPLGVASKQPLISKRDGGRGCLDSTSERAQITEWWTRWPNANIGLATGYEFWALDEDPRHGGDTTRESLERKHGKLPDTLQQVTPTGGRHWLFKNPGFVVSGRAPIHKDLSGLDSRGANNYILAAPSIHEVTRTAYEWDGADEIENQAILSAPDWLIEIIRNGDTLPNGKAAPIEEKIPHGSQHNALVSFAGSMRNRGASVEEIFAALAVMNKNRCERPGPDANIRKIAESAAKWMPGNITGQMRRKLAEEYRRETAMREYVVSPPAAVAESAPAIAPTRLLPPKDPYYFKRLVKTINEQVKPIETNAQIVIASAPDWHGAFCFNEFKHTVHATRSLCDGWIDPMQEIGENEVRMITARAQVENFLTCSNKMIGEAIETVARYSSSHPVRNYLAGLQWDGDPRVDTWLTRYLGVEPSNYAAAVGRRWLLSAVARVMQPGAKVDNCIILEGAQGLGKSTAIKGLCGPDWFCDDVEDLSDKDTKLKLRGKWIIELGELSALSRGEVNQTKAFMSRASDTYRAPYGRTATDYPRQCVFFGTTNHDVYLRDETGNRRFWPLRCNPVVEHMLDLAGIERDRDQIWAEAYLLYCDGQPWHMADISLIREAQEHQAARMEEDPWQAIVASYAEAQGGNCSVEDVLKNAIGMQIEHWTQTTKNRVARCLKISGYEKYRVRVAGALRWRYRIAA